MIRSSSRGPIVALLAVAVLVVAACGSSSSSSSSSTTAKAPAVAPTLPPNGDYVAHLTTQALASAGVDTANVGGGGAWHLSVSPTKLELTPPPPKTDHTTYPVVNVKKHLLTLGGEAACSVYSGQKQHSVYTVSTSPQGLRFVAVKEACKEDGGILTAGPWTKG